jgi:hypothetical protein
MAESAPSISLTIQLANGVTKVLEFNTNDPIMVGSGASSHVKLEGDDVSSLHCMLKPRDGKVYVLDLGSDEGTELNGKELKGETALEDGDVVHVAGARITVHFGGDMLAPTVPIRRAAGHSTTNNDEATVPVRDASPKVEVKTVDNQITAAKKQDARGDAKAAEPRTEKKVEPKKDAHENTELVRERRPPSTTARTATSMEPRKAREREQSVSGFKLGKPTDHRAYRTMSDTDGKAASLAPAMSGEFKATDKRSVDVTAMWGGTVIGVARAATGGAVTIGAGPGASLNVAHPSVPQAEYALVTMTGQGAVIKAASGMEVLVNDRPSESGTVTLESGDTVRVRVGPVELVVQYSKKAPTALVGLTEMLDVFYTKTLAIALMIQLGLIAAMFITPILPNLDDEDLFKNQAEFTKLILAAQEKKKEKKEDLSGKKAAQHKDDAGVFGKKDKPKEDKVASKAGAPKVDKDKREEDRKIAMDALAALGLKGPEGAVSNVFGPGGLGSGVNNALGGLKGASMGDAGGAGGLGSRGTGAGGGGTGLGIGGLGSGTGRGSGGNGNIDLGGRGKGTTKIVPGKITYEGGLSREEIQRVISRVMSQIKYCYEKELNKDPNLEGKLVMFWIISGTGDVQTTQTAQNTFGGASGPAIDQCVSRIIQRLKFPNPKGGGIVNVTYPFVFSASGG